MPEILEAATPIHLAHIRTLWREYWDSLKLEDGFQGFGAELEGLPGLYQPPRGALLLAIARGTPAGTAALRPLGERSCEAKRLYVRPEFRGGGLGRALLDALLAAARQGGYDVIYGDTLPSMTAALALYRAVGFRQVGPYAAQPTPGAVYLRLDL